jgi:transcriptional regulator with XRE-family HTH domain
LEAVEFGHYLKSLRKDKGLTIRQVELYSGVSNAYLSQLENGKRGIPSPEILRKLSDCLDVPYEELMKNAGYLDDGQLVKRFKEGASEDIKYLFEKYEDTLDRAVSVFHEIVMKQPDIESRIADMAGYLNEDYERVKDLMLSSDYTEDLVKHLTIEEKLEILSWLTEIANENNISVKDLFENNEEEQNAGLAYISGGEKVTEDEIEHLKKSLEDYRELKAKLLGKKNPKI